MSEQNKKTDPIVTYYRAIESARLPQRADRSAVGTLPTRAYRYCDAVTTASAFGHYVFAPMDFSLLYDGTDIFWNFAGVDDWMPLDAAQFPGMVARFDEAAPAAMRGCSPPMLTALHEPGAVQIWSGMLARTAPGWSLLARPLANMPGRGGYAMYEGIVETDRWFGPLFTNIRITRTDVPVHFQADWPLFMVQPLPRAVYDEATLARIATVKDLDAFGEGDWADYHRTVVEPNDRSDRMLGEYAVSARKRRKSGGCPYAAAAVAG